MNTRLQVALCPEPEVGHADTSLRYTDILFGFVIKELFLRLQNWSQLDGGVRWHLLVGTTLVLGSWIGFRRSLNRPKYEVKFFNLPLFRFLVDQLMLILYFRIAVLTKVEGQNLPTVSALATNTIMLVLYVFVLYAVWDLLGIWMAKAREPNGLARYPTLTPEGNKNVGQAQTPDWAGLSITVFFLAMFAGLWVMACALQPTWLFLASFILLLAYRVAKEVRTSWRLLLKAPQA